MDQISFSDGMNTSSMQAVCIKPPLWPESHSERKKELIEIEAHYSNVLSKAYKCKF